MKPLPLLCLASVAAGLPLSTLNGQTQASIERNLSVLRSLEGCLEGYAETVAGQTIEYPRLRMDCPRALITRATSGEMAIEWDSAPVTGLREKDSITFVVLAGFDRHDSKHHRYAFSVDGEKRFEYVATDADSWRIDGPGGGTLIFDGAMRDQHDDAFGYLRIVLPAGWVAAERPVRFRMVGEKGGSNNWFMVYPAGDVIPYLRELTAREVYCDLSIERDGDRLRVAAAVTSAWTGRRLELSLGGQSPRSAQLRSAGGGASCDFGAVPGGPGPLQVSIEGRRIIAVDTLWSEGTEERVQSGTLVRLERRVTSAAWRIEYRTRFMPHLASSLAELSRAGVGAGVQHMIISTHQDIAWMDSPDQCIRDRDEKILTPLLDILRSNPAYCFDIEDVLCLREYLDRHPDRKKAIAGWMNQGRLMVGATYTQPYEELCSGEMLARQFYAGRKWLKDNFPGYDTRTAWNPDVPGRSLQMPQVMKKSGVDFLFMSRHERGLYRWLSPDGTGVVAFTPGHYGDYALRTMGLDFGGIAEYTARAALDWGKRVHPSTLQIPIVSMMDMSGPVQPEELLSRWNSLKTLGMEDGTETPLSLPPIRYSTAQGYFAEALKESLDLPVIRGERPNLWLYIHGPTHHQAISAKREADHALPAAETFSTIDALLTGSFRDYPQAQLTAAWEAQIYPDHGWGGKNGEITDSVFRAKYEHARDVGTELAGRATTSIASRVRSDRRKGTPIVVFNSLSWKRSAPVRCSVKFPPGAARGITLVDHSRRNVPVQLSGVRRDADGSVLAAELLFVARDVPSVGYRTYYVRPASGRDRGGAETGVPVRTLENRYYRLSLGSGGVRRLFDKDIRRELLDTTKFLGGELFTMQSVGEDAGEWAEPQQPTMEGFDRLGNHRATWELVESGPVRKVAETRQTIDHVTVLERVILYEELKQVDFEVSLLDWDGTKYREFRLAFPVDAKEGQVAYEVPFGVLEVGKDEMKGAAGERYALEAAATRPRGIQNWIGVSGRDFGVTISSSVAVWDYTDPTDHPVSLPLLQPLLLASRRSCHGAGPWYLQRGDHHYRFSLTSHAPGWEHGKRFGVGANAPLGAVVDPPSSGGPSLPESRSFFSCSADNVVLSTMKKCDNDSSVIVRLYEDGRRDAATTLRFMGRIEQAILTSIIEEESSAVPVTGDRVSMKISPQSIETLKLRPRWK